MDAFEENLKTFGSTIYGKEMRNTLYRCFDLIYVMLTNYTSKIKSIEDRISELEGGGN